jgi:hypothetical protein
MSMSERITLSDESNPPKCCCSVEVTVSNSSVCVFLWPTNPEGHPSGPINWLGVLFWLLWLSGLGLLGLGLTCLAFEKDEYCGGEDAAVAVVSIGGVFSLFTVPFFALLSVCTSDNY